MKTAILSIFISAFAVVASDRSAVPLDGRSSGLIASIIMQDLEEPPDRGLIVDPSGALSSREKQLEAVGIITLSGVVQSETEKAQIGFAVQQQPGVKTVINELVVLETARTNTAPRTNLPQ